MHLTVVWKLKWHRKNRSFVAIFDFYITSFLHSLLAPRGGFRQCVCRQRGPRQRATLWVPWQPATGRRGEWGGCPLPHGRRTGGVRLTQPPVERPPPVPCDKVETVSNFRVFDAHALVWGLDAAWTITRTVVRMLNGFNSRCLHAITGEDYRTTATVPVYNLVLAVRKRRLRYLGHVLRLPAESIVRRSLLALVKGCVHYPEGSLFSDCEASLPQLEAQSLDRSAWRDRVSSLTLTVTFHVLLS